MAKKHRQRDEEAWRNAKALCRLNARQVEMARALGMNPKKLPGLRPSPQQRWKLPVGAFIEECHRKRFGGHPQDHQRVEPEPRSRKPKLPDAQAPGNVQNPIPLPPRQRRTGSSWRGGLERTVEGEDEIPF